MSGAITHTRKILSFLLKLSLTLGAFGFVFYNIDLAQLESIWRTQDHSYIGWAMGLFLLQVSLGAMRWHMIVAALVQRSQNGLKVSQSFRLYYISVFFNCCLPGTVGGDVVRVWLTRKHTDSLSLSIHSVVIDRIISLVSLGVLVLLTLPFMAHILGFSASSAMVVSLAGLLLCAVGLVFGRWLIHLLRRVLSAQWISYFLESIQLLFHNPRMSLASLVYAAIAHGSFCVLCYVLAQSMSIALDPWQAFTLMPIVLLITTLPISIGGWGVRELGMVGMLSLIQVPTEQATLLGIEIGLIAILASLPAGILWLVHRQTAHTDRP